VDNRSPTINTQERAASLACDPPKGERRSRGGAFTAAQPLNVRPAFFSFFAARFSMRLLAGFFLTSFLVSLALLMSDSRDQAVRRTGRIASILILLHPRNVFHVPANVPGGCELPDVRHHQKSSGMICATTAPIFVLVPCRAAPRSVYS